MRHVSSYLAGLALPAIVDHTIRMSAETPYPDGNDASSLAEYNWLLETEARLRHEPGNAVARRMRDNAAARYWRAVAAENQGRDRLMAQTASRNADMMDASETPSDLKEHLATCAIVAGAALLFGAMAGAAAAVAVKESILREVIKGAVGGLVTTAGSLATEQALSRRRPHIAIRTEAAQPETQQTRTGPEPRLRRTRTDHRGNQIYPAAGPHEPPTDRRDRPGRDR
jgi:hypothetical protein